MRELSPSQGGSDLNARDILKQRVGNSQVAWAKAHGVSPAYVSDVLAGRREPGKLVLDALGLERVVTYRRKKEKANER